MADKFYIGLHNGEWQVFAADDPKEATPEASGYDAVDGAYDTQEEAEQACAAAND
jgi:hypothetical protein